MSKPRPAGGPTIEAAPSDSSDPLASVLAAAVQALPLAVTIHDRSGACVLQNAAARALPQNAAASIENAWQQHPATGSSVVIADDGQTIVENRVDEIDVAGQRFWVSTAVDITAQRALETELFDRAYVDALTGLPNDALIQQATETLLESHGQDSAFMLAVVDIDNLRHVNDYYGHEAGDALLSKIGARLSEGLGPHDLVARTGGDEFVMLLVTKDGAAHEDLDTLTARLKNPFFILGYEIFVSASVGAAQPPFHGTSYQTLRRNAESALHRVKRGTKGAAALFNASMAQAVTERMEVEQRLRSALRDRRFCCAFQPKVDIVTRDVIGVEVLLRWRDERGEVKGPGDFVGLAVELGLINEITWLVLDETIRLMDTINDVFGPQASISVNIAAKQAEDIPFMRSFVEALAATGYPARFMVELTEEAFFAKSQFQAEVLPLLRAIGTRVSIDDFGVGYSSLAALADITADELKIDRSFITDIHRRPRSQSILRAIESLATALGMSVTAEGVETAEELAYLQEATRIRLAQGFFFAKPLMLEHESAEGFLSSRSPGSARDAAIRTAPIRARAGRRS